MIYYMNNSSVEKLIVQNTYTDRIISHLIEISIGQMKKPVFCFVLFSLFINIIIMSNIVDRIVDDVPT